MSKLILPLPARVTDAHLFRSIKPGVLAIFRLRALLSEDEFPDEDLLKLTKPNNSMPTVKALKQEAKEMFSHPLKDKYIESYKSLLEESFGLKAVEEKTDEQVEEEYEKWAKRFKQNVPEILDAMVNADDKSQQLEAIKMFYARVMKEDEVLDELPRRYLSEKCSTCRYKVFVEDNCEDECTRCRYKLEMNEQGVFYDHKTQLIAKNDSEESNINI